MSGQVRVLVVEDSEDHAVLLTRHLESWECDVLAVSTAEDALDALGDAEFALAVVDLLLPGMDGWELVRRIRVTAPRTAVAVTSVLEPGDFPDADAVLPKPFTRAQVRQVLSDTVDGR
jgi:CheY-like chemotaxis protein